jgi:hypothetical protein
VLHPRGQNSSSYNVSDASFANKISIMPILILPSLKVSTKQSKKAKTISDYLKHDVGSTVKRRQIKDSQLALVGTYFSVTVF